MNDEARKETIRRLNDQLRTTLGGGRTMMTSSIQALGEATMASVLAAVKGFNTFSRDNDPHQEHDFGSIEVDGEKIFWKIDYYDKAMEHGSDDPADPRVTTRVLTIMLAGEY